MVIPDITKVHNSIAKSSRQLCDSPKPPQRRDSSESTASELGVEDYLFLSSSESELTVQEHAGEIKSYTIMKYPDEKQNQSQQEEKKKGDTGTAANIFHRCAAPSGSFSLGFVVEMCKKRCRMGPSGVPVPDENELDLTQVEADLRLFGRPAKQPEAPKKKKSRAKAPLFRKLSRLSTIEESTRSPLRALE